MEKVKTLAECEYYSTKKTLDIIAKYPSATYKIMKALNTSLKWRLDLKRITIYIVIAVVCVGINCKCWNPFNPDEKPPEEQDKTDRSTAVKCLEYFMKAYNSRDIVKYEECLASDFAFELKPSDYYFDEKGEQVTKWSKTLDVEATKYLFQNTVNINLHFPSIPEGSESGDLTSFSVPFQLYVYLEGESSEPYYADGSAVFSLRQNKDTKLWEIVIWEDKSTSEDCMNFMKKRHRIEKNSGASKKTAKK